MRHKQLVNFPILSQNDVRRLNQDVEDQKLMDVVFDMGSRKALGDGIPSILPTLQEYTCVELYELHLANTPRRSISPILMRL